MNDEFDRAFLGNGPVRQMDGQRANAQRQNANFERQAARERLDEAAELAVEAIHWLIGRASALGLDDEQEVFAGVLAAHHLRRTFPADRGGTELFDQVNEAAWAYWDKTGGRAAEGKPVERKVTVVEHEAKATAAATLAQNLVRWLNDMGTGRDLDDEQRIFALSLIFINLRQHLPAQSGGRPFFDEVARAAGKYYDEKAA